MTINGILKNHSTVDCIFILKSLVDRYVKSKPKTKQNKLFTCFVDFKRAFDSIPREKLFQKIEKAGINGKFLSVLSSMYLNDCSAIKQNGYITETFKCRVGVKQGCMLSPTLFNLFLSDLPDTLNKAPVKEDISIKGVKLRSLLYADDLAIETI